MARAFNSTMTSMSGNEAQRRFAEAMNPGEVPAVPEPRFPELNMAPEPSLGETAKTFRLCYYTQFVYSSEPLRSDPPPHRIIPVPGPPMSPFELTIEVRTNLCTPTWGTPLEEAEGCSMSMRTLQEREEVLLGQIHLTVALVRKQGDAGNHVEYGETANPEGAYVLLNRYDRPDVFFYRPPATAGDRARVACGDIKDHLHPHAVAYPDTLTAPTGYLHPNSQAANATALLAAERWDEPGFVPRAQAQLVRALRWALAARSEDPAHIAVQDGAQWEAVSPLVHATINQLQEAWVHAAVESGFIRLRELCYQYEQEKNR